MPEILLIAELTLDADKVVLWTGMASAFSQMQLLGILWQMKKRYSCWPFDFVGADHYFIGILKFTNQGCK